MCQMCSSVDIEVRTCLTVKKEKANTSMKRVWHIKRI